MKPDTKPLRLLSVKQVAAMLGISISTLYCWVGKGQFPSPAKILGRPRWKEDDVIQYPKSRLMRPRFN